MRRAVVTLLLAGLVSVPAFAALKAGDAAPGFSARASMAGKEFRYSLKDALKKGPVVVYFYPSAFTSGCNVQAHTFSENKERFDLAGATIVGVSRDSIERLNEFSADPQYCAGKIAVASDPQGTIATSYDLKTLTLPPGLKDTRGVAIDHEFTERTTFIVTPDLKVAATLSTNDDKITPAQHVDRALAVVQQLAARR
jgi:peroxiredoxin